MGNPAHAVMYGDRERTNERASDYWVTQGTLLTSLGTDAPGLPYVTLSVCTHTLPITERGTCREQGQCHVLTHLTTSTSMAVRFRLFAFTSACFHLPTHNREPYDTLLYCPQHHVPIDPYAERMPRADCSSNTIRDSISRVSPSLRGPRFTPALRHARRPCALTRGRPAVPRQPGTGTPPLRQLGFRRSFST